MDISKDDEDGDNCGDGVVGDVDAEDGGIFMWKPLLFVHTNSVIAV